MNENDKDVEPIKVFGNLEWQSENGAVKFVASDKNYFDGNEARFCLYSNPNLDQQRAF